MSFTDLHFPPEVLDGSLYFDAISIKIKGIST